MTSHLSKSKLIGNVYYDPAPGFGSAQRTFNHLRRLYPDSTVEYQDVVGFIKQQEVAQIHHPVLKPKVFYPILSRRLDEEWQADLIDLPRLAKANNGYRYILVCIEIYSRYLFPSLSSQRKGRQPSKKY